MGGDQITSGLVGIIRTLLLLGVRGSHWKVLNKGLTGPTYVQKIKSGSSVEN